MAFPDPSLERPLERPRGNPDNLQDVVPPTERNLDPERDRVEHGLSFEGSRPLTDDEKKAADRDGPVAERVYAPASERVPVEPVPGHRDFVEHMDTHTPEREAAGQATPSHSSSEPSFARVSRPTTPPTATPAGYGSAMSHPGSDMYDNYASKRGSGKRRRLFMGIGFSWGTVICTAVGVWLFMRWRRERNKPINRIRRQAVQAVQAASELRERVPLPDDAARPAMGLTTALLSMLVVLWQQSQARSRSVDKKMRHQAGKASSRVSDAASDLDWQKRLMHLKERWTPGRVELEKVSISRH
ncbi:MAG TPA: hypothetical protein VGQ62_12445 [Chloroflexota bacterium]|jgi:hypothetical protein|nr:hypothetical protein [Chloroflexota bacterium]